MRPYGLFGGQPGGASRNVLNPEGEARPLDSKLTMTIRRGDVFRHELPGGVPVYLAPTDEFPLVTISFTFKGGAYLESAEDAGLASVLGSQMRRGGTTSVSAGKLDERFDSTPALVGGRIYLRGQRTLYCIEESE